MVNEKDMILPITLKGEVVHGKALGRTVGMPTANLRVVEGELPPAGVYAAKVKVRDKIYCSVTNVGRRPTVDDEQKATVESFILDFHEDIYGEQMEVEIVKYLRGIQKFADLEAVSKQVKKDIEEAKRIFKKDA